jgi:signal transduction histidine kinase/PAS domain-containing protein
MGALYEQEFRARRADGDYRWLLARAVPIRDAQGTVLEWCGFYTDITERKHAEEERSRLLREAQEARAAAEATSRQLQAVLDVLPVGIYISDGTGRVLQKNPAATAIWGDSAPLLSAIDQYGQYRGWKADSGEPMRPEDWPMARALRTGMPVRMDEILIETFDGHRKVIQSQGVPIRDAAGTIVGGVSMVLDVTESKRLVAAQLQSAREAAAHAAELEAIFEGITDAIIFVDRDGRILHMNGAYRALFGFGAVPDDLVHDPGTRAELIVPRDVTGRPLALEERPRGRILAGEILTGSNTMDMLARTVAGQDIYVNACGAPIRNAGGEIVGCVLIFRDITARITLEREAAARAARLEAILQAMADGVFVFDTRGGVVEMNTAGRELFKIDQAMSDLAAPLPERGAQVKAYDAQDRPMPQAAWPLNRVLRGEVLKGPTAVDQRLLVADGREVDVQVSGAPLRTPDGSIAGAVCVVRDVTERRELERQTQATLSALLTMALSLVAEPPAAGQDAGATASVFAASRRLARLTRTVLGCTWVNLRVFDAHGGPVVEAVASDADDAMPTPATEARIAALGLDAPSLAARLQGGEVVVVDPTLPPWHDRDLQGVRGLLLAPMRVGHTLLGVLALDYDCAPSRFTTQQRTLAGAVANLVGLVLERVRLRGEWAQAEAREMALTETNRRMNEFLGVAGHELRTPLTTISANAQMVTRRLRQVAVVAGAGPAQVSEFVRPIQDMVSRIHQQAGRLNRLVEDLLDVSRIEAQKLEMRMAACDLVAVVREVVHDQQQLNAGRRINLQTPGAVLPRVYGDADRLAQVVTNFLTNALKYSRAEFAVDVTVHLEHVKDEDWVCVSVRDRGPGLSPQEQQHIWQRFYRAEGVEIQTGSGIGLGLGLYISHTIIARHSGEIGVHSVRGEGSTFWFRLPVLPAPV